MTQQETDHARVLIPQWLGWVRRLQAIAQAGLEYTEGEYDRERYHALSTIAAEIASAHSAAPLDRLIDLFVNERGYATPKLDVRGVVFRQDKLLLVQEASDGLWTLPGGWVDPGDTPRSAVEREIKEESGYDTNAVEILDVVDRERDGHPTQAFSVWKIFLRCEYVGGEATSSLETTDVGWFASDALPPLSTGRTLEHQLMRFFSRRQSPPSPARFN